MKKEEEDQTENTKPKVTEFKMFSEGLNKLKLKKSTNQPQTNNNPNNAAEKVMTTTTIGGSDLTDLERLLMQLKVSNNNETGGNISVNNNFNINFNSNINIKTNVTKENNKLDEKTNKLGIIKSEETSRTPQVKKEEMTEIIAVAEKTHGELDDEIPEVIINTNINLTGEMNKANEKDLFNNRKNDREIFGKEKFSSNYNVENISDIRVDSNFNKNDDEEDMELKKIIYNNQQNSNNKKIAIINDIFEDSSIIEAKNEDNILIENNKNIPNNEHKVYDFNSDSNYNPEKKNNFNNFFGTKEPETVNNNIQSINNTRNKSKIPPLKEKDSDFSLFNSKVTENNQTVLTNLKRDNINMDINASLASNDDIFKTSENIIGNNSYNYMIINQNSNIRIQDEFQLQTSVVDNYNDRQNKVKETETPSEKKLPTNTNNEFMKLIYSNGPVEIEDTPHKLDYKNDASIPTTKSQEPFTIHINDEESPKKNKLQNELKYNRPVEEIQNFSSLNETNLQNNPLDVKVSNSNLLNKADMISTFRSFKNEDNVFLEKEMLESKIEGDNPSIKADNLFSFDKKVDRKVFPEHNTKLYTDQQENHFTNEIESMKNIKNPKSTNESLVNVVQKDLTKNKIANDIMIDDSLLDTNNNNIKNEESIFFDPKEIVDMNDNNFERKLTTKEKLITVPTTKEEYKIEQKINDIRQSININSNEIDFVMRDSNFQLKENEKIPTPVLKNKSSNEIPNDFKNVDNFFIKVNPNMQNMYQANEAPSNNPNENEFVFEDAIEEIPEINNFTANNKPTKSNNFNKLTSENTKESNSQDNNISHNNQTKEQNTINTFFAINEEKDVKNNTNEQNGQVITSQKKEKVIDGEYHSSNENPEPIYKRLQKKEELQSHKKRIIEEPNQELKKQINEYKIPEIGKESKESKIPENKLQESKNFNENNLKESQQDIGENKIQESKTDLKDNILKDPKKDVKENILQDCKQNAQSDKHLEPKKEIIDIETVQELKIPLKKDGYTSNNYGNELISTEENPLIHNNKEYIKLTNFEKEETHYNETVNDFATIFKEKNYIFLKRRNQIMQNGYYRSYILSENNIIDKYKKLPHSYNEILEDALNNFQRESDFKSIFQDVIGDDNNFREEVIKMLENNKGNDISLIGKVKPVTKFLENYYLTNDKDPQVCNDTLKDIASWRDVYCDGDSFYRIFMFGLFEYYILSQNIHEVKKLILDIYRIHKNPGATLFKTRNMNFNTVLVIFSLIIEHLQNNKPDKAYNILLKAYILEDRSFDLVLIGYMRLILWLNISELVKQISKIKKQNTNKGLSRKSTSTEANQLEFEELNINTLLVYQNEPFKLCLSLVPLVFNVNLEIFAYDGSVHQNKNGILFIKRKFSVDDVNDVPVFSLCYNISSYSKFYTKQQYGMFKKILQLQEETNLIKNAHIGKLENCDKCGVQTKSLRLTKYGKTVCLECIKIYVNSVIEKRAIIFHKENYINREYYARMIELTGKVFLDDQDIMIIFGTNITTLLLEALKQICFSCDKTIDELIHLECSCQMCRECLVNLIKKATNGDMVLNKFERKRVETYPCSCNLPFNVENGLKIINQTNREFKANAIQRLELYAKHICMRCTVPLRNESEDIEIPKSTNEYYRLKILFDQTARDSNKEIARVDHLVCVNCIDKILKFDSVEKRKLEKMGAHVDIKPTTKIIPCKICEEDHVIDIKEWNSIFKRPCCDGCIIY